MTTINTAPSITPASFRSEIRLPPAPPPVPQDRATTLLLQDAGGAATSELRAPDLALLNGATDWVAAERFNGAPAAMKRVIAECNDMLDRNRDRLKALEATRQQQAWEQDSEAIQKNMEGSVLQRNSKIIQSAGQMSGGLFEARAGANGVMNQAKLHSLGNKAKGHEDRVTSEHDKLQNDTQAAGRLKVQIKDLETAKNNHPGQAADIDKLIGHQQKQLALVEKSIANRTKVIQDESAAATTARQAEQDMRHTSGSNDAELALARGVSACLNGSAGAFSAQEQFKGEQKQFVGQNKKMLADKNRGEGQQFQSNADKNQQDIDKNLDLLKSVSQAGSPNYS